MRTPLTRRAPQLRVAFSSERPLDSYYNDLRSIALAHGGPAASRVAVESMTRDRTTANPVSVVQIGLGAWQLRESDPSWLLVVADVAEWLLGAMEEDGRLLYLFPLAHTYELQAPWLSAMAQGEAVSLLLRASRALENPSLAAAAVQASASLLDPDSAIVVVTDDGPVLQEYPTDPPAHVLNGWIYALFGLHDLAAAHQFIADDLCSRARDAFGVGSETLAARLPRYRTWPTWSRYDLFPHPLTHVSSPYYHRLHVELLGTMRELTGLPALGEFEAEWARSAESELAIAAAVGRKVAFRVLRPRRRMRAHRLPGR